MQVPSTIRRSLLGQTFGNWTVLEFAGYTNVGGPLWLCRCACGRKQAVLAGNLAYGCSTRCHKCYPHGPGLSKTPEYAVWRKAKRRDGVCKAWQNFEGFAKAMLPRPTGHFLLRRNTAKPHGPGNSFWSPVRRSAKRYLGKTVAEWSQILGITRQAIQLRLQKCPPREALVRDYKLRDYKPGRPKGPAR